MWNINILGLQTSSKKYHTGQFDHPTSIDVSLLAWNNVTSTSPLCASLPW